MTEPSAATVTTVMPLRRDPTTPLQTAGSAGSAGSSRPSQTFYMRKQHAGVSVGMISGAYDVATGLRTAVVLCSLLVAVMCYAVYKANCRTRWSARDQHFLDNYYRRRRRGRRRREAASRHTPAKHDGTPVAPPPTLDPLAMAATARWIETQPLDAVSVGAAAAARRACTINLRLAGCATCAASRANSSLADPYDLSAAVALRQKFGAASAACNYFTADDADAAAAAADTDRNKTGRNRCPMHGGWERRWGGGGGGFALAIHPLLGGRVIGDAQTVAEQLRTNALRPPDVHRRASSLAGSRRSSFASSKTRHVVSFSLDDDDGDAPPNNAVVGRGAATTTVGRTPSGDDVTINIISCSDEDIPNIHPLLCPLPPHPTGLWPRAAT